MNKQDKKVLDLYQNKQWSTYQIAESLGTYPNKIRRILKNSGVELRDSSSAQKNALDQGRATHPTEGYESSSETKEKISESQGKVWDALDEEGKKYRSEIGKKSWEQKKEDEKQELIARAQDAVRESSKHGSKLERFLLSELGKQNIKVEFHKERWLRNQKLQVDLYLPTYRTAIEVDGPSHFKPVWGTKNLEHNIKADQQKTGLILGNGLVLIRIKQTQSITQRYMRQVLQKLLVLLDTIKGAYPKETERYFEI